MRILNGNVEFFGAGDERYLVTEGRTAPSSGTR
jgi:hypothetical protein